MEGGAAGQAEGRGLPRKVVGLGGERGKRDEEETGGREGGLSPAPCTWASQDSLGIAPHPARAKEVCKPPLPKFVGLWGDPSPAALCARRCSQRVHTNAHMDAQPDSPERCTWEAMGGRGSAKSHLPLPTTIT